MLGCVGHVLFACLYMSKATAWAGMLSLVLADLWYLAANLAATAFLSRYHLPTYHQGRPR